MRNENKIFMNGLAPLFNSRVKTIRAYGVDVTSRKEMAKVLKLSQMFGKNFLIEHFSHTMTVTPAARLNDLVKEGRRLEKLRMTSVATPAQIKALSKAMHDCDADYRY